MLLHSNRILMASLGVLGAGLGVPGLVWACQGQSGEPGPVWDATANLGRQSQSGMPGPIWDARASLGVPGPVWGCQGQFGAPGPIWDARTSLGSQGQFRVPGVIWGAGLSLGHQGQPNLRAKLWVRTQLLVQLDVLCNVAA